MNDDVVYEVKLPPMEPVDPERYLARLLVDLESQSPATTKVEREYRAFLRQLPALVVTHKGRYVAIHEGQVIDSDGDDAALSRRVHAALGAVEVQIGLVVIPQPVGRIPGPREIRHSTPGSGPTSPGGTPPSAPPSSS